MTWSEIPAETVHIVSEGYQVLWSSLEMVVVRGRSPALGTVVEEGEGVVLARQVQHVDVSVPYGLVGMPYGSDDQMVRKYRIGVDKDMVLLALASLELKHRLLRRTVFPAQETFPGGYVSLAELSCRGYYPGRVELESDGKASGIYLPCPDILQGTVVSAGKRPLGKLVTNELMQYLVILHRSSLFWLQVPRYGSCPCRGCWH